MAPRSFLPHLLAVVGLLWSTLLAPAQQPKDSPPLVPTLPLVPSPTQPQPIPLPPLPPPVFQPLPLRFTFKIDPKAPVKDLLPTPPQAQLPLLYLNEDLAKVPEVMFGEPLRKDLGRDKVLEQTAHIIAKINHLNVKKTDGFMEAMIAQRADLRGLP